MARSHTAGEDAPRHSIVELSSDDLVEVEDNRASIIAAAATAQNIAMLTGTHGVISPPLSSPHGRLPAASDIHPQALPDPDDAELGRLRAFVTARSGDPVGALRARLELARAELDRGHTNLARREAEAASQACAHAKAAQSMLRGLAIGRDNVEEQLARVAELVAQAATPSERADWLSERARLLEAEAGTTEASLTAWNDALALVPTHVGALYGAEAALRSSNRYAELADLLARLADLTEDPHAAAWFHVERALVLDHKLSDLPGARTAFVRALDLSPGIGPVRAAFVDQVAHRRDDAQLAALLESEASLEPDNARAARLELDSALAHLRAGTDRHRIVKVLERAHGRAPSAPLVDLRVAEELARLHDADDKHGDALRVRKAALKFLDDPREELIALRALASSAEHAGEIDDAILAVERARMLESDDTTLLDDLDRLLTLAKRHEARTVLWMREAARADEATKKARALLLSADAARAAGRESDAARQREAAWLTAPDAPGVYEALAERLVPVAPGQAIHERLSLYEQAARGTKEPARKVHLLEKMAWLHDDIAGDAAGAARLYEEILEIEPGRMSAILGLGSAARRAGNDKALARALLAQAGVTTDSARAAELRLRAAEALVTVDPERALALAESLENEPTVRARVLEVLTRFHRLAQRWDRAAKTLALRAAESSDGAQKLALTLAEVDVLLHRLHDPERALAAMAGLPSALADDAAVRAASLAALESIGDERRLRTELGGLAERTKSKSVRARLLLRAAELDEKERRDEEAAATYELAREASADEKLLVDRLVRVGARTPLGEASLALVPPLTAALRTIDGDHPGTAEPLLATGARDLPTLRTAERLARQAKSAPQLANALALMADAYPSGFLAKRAYEGLASLFAWTLPPSDDYEPWERLLALGSKDVVVMDTLVWRAAGGVHAGDGGAIRASVAALGVRLETVTDDTERLLLNLDIVRLLRRASAATEARAYCKQALAADPTSLTAASFLAEVAVELRDDESSITASRALADIVADQKARSILLRDAADLADGRGDKDLAVDLLEKALRADPEAVETAARLSNLQRARGDWGALARALRDALEKVTAVDVIVPLASELADIGRNNVSDPILAISALERIREVQPNHVPSLLLLAELFIGQRAWDKALIALDQAARATNEPAEKLTAYVGRATIFRRVMNQPARAEAELRAALEIDPHDPRAVRGLLDLGDAIPKDERAALLGRLVVGETTPAERLKVLIELADARRAVGDVEGAEGALVEAASISPDPRMLERVRAAIGNDTQTLARVLARAVSRAHESGRAIDPTWLVKLGTIELELGRLDAAVERFEEALRTDDSRDDARILLARALAAGGRHEPAVAVLSPVIASRAQRMPIDTHFVRLLESSLSGAGRSAEQWVARELRAVAGDLPPNEQAELDARASNVLMVEGLSAPWLRTSVMPGILGRHPVWEVAAAAAPLAGKLARVGLAEMGSSTRERVKPRTPHPIRPLFDRVAKAFDLPFVELATSEHVMAPVIACEDVPWVVVPASLGSYTDAYALAALARPMVRISLGVPWLGALGSHEVLALLVAFARQVAPNFSALPAERVEANVPDCEQRVRKAIDRKRRRVLEDLAPMLDRAPAIEESAFAEAVAATEARAAFLLSGSLRASLEAVAPTDATLAQALRMPGPPSLAAVFGRSSSRDLASFALQSETTALRRSIVTS